MMSPTLEKAARNVLMDLLCHLTKRQEYQSKIARPVRKVTTKISSRNQMLDFDRTKDLNARSKRRSTQAPSSLDSPAKVGSESVLASNLILEAGGNNFRQEILSKSKKKGSYFTARAIFRESKINRKWFFCTRKGCVSVTSTCKREISLTGLLPRPNTKKRICAKETQLPCP